MMRADILVLFMIFRGEVFNILTSSIMVAVDFFLNTLYQSEKVLSFLTFLRIFTINEILGKFMKRLIYHFLKIFLSSFGIRVILTSK